MVMINKYPEHLKIYIRSQDRKRIAEWKELLLARGIDYSHYVVSKILDEYKVPVVQPKKTIINTLIEERRKRLLLKEQMEKKLDSEWKRIHPNLPAYLRNFPMDQWPLFEPTLFGSDYEMVDPEDEEEEEEIVPPANRLRTAV